ncbi:MAG: CRISPR-associated endonuclease Cas1 [Marinilabiliales bacterium]
MDLILNTYGTTLIKKDNQFLVIHNDGNQLVHPEKVKSIHICKGAKISSDAVILAIENGIDVLFVDRKGNPHGRIWSVQFGSVTTIRRKQIDFTLSKQAIPWIKDLLIKKIENQIALLLTFVSDDIEKSKNIENAINKMQDYMKKINSAKGDTVSDLAPSFRGWEGLSSKLYYSVISDFVPEDFKFNGRTQHPAKDVFNAILNYGYGFLYGKIESALIKAGIDPYVGVLHRENYNRPVLVFDLIEKYRVWVDYVVINIINQRVITEECYSVKPDGSYWLEALGKRILLQSLNDYMDEVVNINGIDRSRANHITIDAQKLATFFLNFKADK